MTISQILSFYSAENLRELAKEIYDAEITGEALYCGTFDEKDLQEEINRIEKLADEIWWENDLTKEACDFYSNPEFAQSEVDNG